MSFSFEPKLLKTVAIPDFSNLRLVLRYGNSIFASLGTNIVEINYDTSCIDKIQLSEELIVAKPLRIHNQERIYVGDSYSIREFDPHQLKCTNRYGAFCPSSTFTKEFSTDGTHMLFAKYHTNYSKFSINIYDTIRQSTKIVKLLSNPPRNILLCNDSYILYQEEEYLKQMNLDNLATKAIQSVDNVLTDANNYYLIDEYKVKGYSMKNMSEICEFKTNNIITKIEEVGDCLMVGSKAGIDIFDKRDFDKPLKTFKINALIDFIFDPNLQLLFANDSDLLIYNT